MIERRIEILSDLLMRMKESDKLSAPQQKTAGKLVDAMLDRIEKAIKKTKPRKAKRAKS